MCPKIFVWKFTPSTNRIKWPDVINLVKIIFELFIEDITLFGYWWNYDAHLSKFEWVQFWKFYLPKVTIFSSSCIAFMTQSWYNEMEEWSLVLGTHSHESCQSKSKVFLQSRIMLTYKWEILLWLTNSKTQYLWSWLRLFVNMAVLWMHNGFNQQNRVHEWLTSI